MNVYTSGSFDLFHVGHLNMLKKAKELCGDVGKLTVGIHTDESIFKRKGRHCIIPYSQRFAIVQALKCVDACMKLNGFEEFEQQLRDCNADIWVLGDDYTGKFDGLDVNCKIVYIPRTSGISTTEIMRNIRAACK